MLLASASAAQVHLNEILADPGTDWNGDGTVDSKLDEWVEIMNTGTSSVDLANYRISDAVAATSFRFALSGTLAPGEVKVYFGSDVVAWQAANGVAQQGLSHNNSGDTVFLYLVDGSDLDLADSRTYASAEVLDDRATGRLPNGTGEWVIFDALNPYKGSQPPIPTVCSPSPGEAVQCPTASQASTWGLVKSLYKG
jgi:hypothetical protein